MPTSVNVSGGTLNQYATLRSGFVAASPDPLKIDVESFLYDIGGLRGTYAGATSQSVTNNDTSYVYIDSDATLNITTAGWPTDESYIALARVVASGGEITAIHDARTLLATSAAVQGTCRIGFPVDSGVRGGNAGASSNNTVASITFDDVGESRNRWNCRPPQNYISGDLTLRLLCSFAATPANNDTVRWQLDWQFLDDGDIIPSSYTYSTTLSQDVDHLSNDEFFKVDFTITAAQFDKTADMIAFYLRRDADHVDDDCAYMVHIHLCELRYTGYRIAGQAGQ